MEKQPNILMIMCDQFRYDCIAAHGNPIIRTPNLDRLARRGISFSNAYSTCPVCIPARYTIRTGREPHTTGLFENGLPVVEEGRPRDMQERCGKYLGFVMQDLGYRTFGIGKAHTYPDMFEDEGFMYDLRAEEMWGTMEQREGDAYIQFLKKNYPAYTFVEQVYGERTDMYYMPQTRPFPQEATVEAFTVKEAIEQINVKDPRPFYGLVSFICPHPPCAPPIPYNRMYNPDLFPDAVVGDIEIDHMDEQIPYANHYIWADGINSFLARSLKARYYGEITYLDKCIGEILDAVEARDDADNTLILFLSDHGDMLGDHHAWQKECYFQSACRVPFLLSWPAKLPANTVNDAIVCHADIISLFTSAAGAPVIRDGMDILKVALGEEQPRKQLIATYGRPGTPNFKVMLREGDWKYILMTNGNREQLFNLRTDPNELVLENDKHPELIKRFRADIVNYLKAHGITKALDGDDIKTYPFTQRPLWRVKQFDYSLGIRDYLINDYNK